ncbi:MAG TPA: 1-acyl-sn-glycerol-3-phosphate acyltransferase, partial [Flavipsychrobacter sp.]
MMNMFPVYRMSEGKDKLDYNHKTFADCLEILKQNGCVLIFSEGTCINEWKLRPLKKGTARLAWMCWAEQGVKDMIVQPVGINYHSFTQVPKRMHVGFAPVITVRDYDLSNEAGFYKEFNRQLAARIAPLVLEEHHPALKKKKTDHLLKLMPALPALVGAILHVPLYKLLRSIVRSKTRGTVFFDSVLFASLLLVYPLLVLLVATLSVILTGNHLYWLFILLLPFTAWCYRLFKAA